MQLTLEIPEDIAQSLASAAFPATRAALEGMAAEAYRSGALSEDQLTRLLGLESRFEVHQWLSKRSIPLHYNEQDLADDLATLRELGLLDHAGRR